jgi:DivIVA domain-containing protein
VTAQTGFGGGVYERGRRLSADQVRSATFGRTPRGRRGLIEEEVSSFLHRVAEEFGGLEDHLAAARAENARLKAALRDWQTQRGGAMAQRGGGAVQRGGGEGMPVDVVNLISRAQRQIEAQVAETERYCRLREEEARQRYDEIVHEARRHAEEEAERVVRAYRASAGSGYSPEGERAERTTAWLNALLRSLEALAAHVDATRHAFAVEVEKVTHKPTHVDSGGQPHGVGPGRT